MSGPLVVVLVRMFALDLRSLALFRIGVGLALLLDCATRALDARAFLTDEGVLPRALWFQTQTQSAELWSFHVATGSLPGTYALLLIGAALALMLLVGWHARIASIASLVLLVSLHNRNLQVFYGFDLLLRVALLWLCFLPSSARFSLDERRPHPVSDDDTHPPGAQHISAATIAFTLQMVVIYVFSGIQKLQDDSWRTLDAVWLGLTTDNHASSVARALSEHYDVTRALTVAVLALELAVPYLLLLPVRNRARDALRLFVVAAFVVFHIATAVLFELGLFPLIGVVVWLAFLPARVWGAETRHEVTWGKRRAVALAVGMLFVIILASNIESVTRPFMPASLRSAMLITRVAQNWNMFERAMGDGWFIARGTRENGTSLDLLRGGAPVSLEKPADVAATFETMRWRKYVTGLVRVTGIRHRRPFLMRLCNEWKASTGEKLFTVELVMMQETEHPKRPSLTTMRTLGAVECR